MVEHWQLQEEIPEKPVTSLFTKVTGVASHIILDSKGHSVQILDITVVCTVGEPVFGLSSSQRIFDIVRNNCVCKLLLDIVRNTGTAPHTTQTGYLIFFTSVAKGTDIQEQLKPEPI